MLQDCHIGSVFLNSSDSTAVHIICLWSIPHHLLVPRPPTRRPIPFPPIHSSSLSFEPRCHDSSSLSQSANTATILPKHLHQQILYQWTPLNPHVPFVCPRSTLAAAPNSSPVMCSRPPWPLSIDSSLCQVGPCDQAFPSLLMCHLPIISTIKSNICVTDWWPSLSNFSMLKHTLTHTGVNVSFCKFLSPRWLLTTQNNGKSERGGSFQYFELL